MVLSLAIFNNLVLTMSSQIGKPLANRRMQKLENLHNYVLRTLCPVLVHLDEQHSEFLESWMAYVEFDEFPDFILSTTLLLEMVHYLSKSTQQSKNVHCIRILNTLYILPNHISSIVVK